MVGNILVLSSYEYLGDSILHDLCWKNHCNKITKRANKTLGLLCRILSLCSKEVEIMASQALVRPQLENAAEAWNPYNITTADHLKRIQRSATVLFTTTIDVQHP